MSLNSCCPTGHPAKLLAEDCFFKYIPIVGYKFLDFSLFLKLPYSNGTWAQNCKIDSDRRQNFWKKILKHNSKVYSWSWPKFFPMLAIDHLMRQWAPGSTYYHLRICDKYGCMYFSSKCIYFIMSVYVHLYTKCIWFSSKKKGSSIWPRTSLKWRRIWPIAYFLGNFLLLIHWRVGHSFIHSAFSKCLL